MDAKAIRELQEQVKSERQKAAQDLEKRLEKEKAEAIERGKRDGKAEVYQKILAEVKKKVRETYDTSLEYDFSEHNRNYLESLLKSLIAKLIKEGFKVPRMPNIEHHYSEGGYEMDYGHVDPHWWYTAKLEVSW